MFQGVGLFRVHPYTSSIQESNKIWLMLARKERQPSLLYAMPASLLIK